MHGPTMRFIVPSGFKNKILLKDTHTKEVKGGKLKVPFF